VEKRTVFWGASTAASQLRVTFIWLRQVGHQWSAVTPSGWDCCDQLHGGVGLFDANKWRELIAIIEAH